MSGALRGYAQQAAKALLRKDGAPQLQQQSRRWVGDLPVKNNKYIEDWGTFRENVEQTFKFDAKTLASLSVWVVAVPVILYKCVIEEFETSDKVAGRQRRDFM